MAAEAVLWAEHHSFSLTARYIPSKKNVQADHSVILPRFFSRNGPFFQGSSRGFAGVWSSPSRPLYHPRQCQASFVHLSGSGPNGLEAERIPASLGPPTGLCLPTVGSAQTGLVERASFNQALVGSGGAVVATERVVC